jgi:2-polyprenyl-3-methyl-5-hydroxy-6-metoxy-1,4-benzoquinol methylase
MGDIREHPDWEASIDSFDWYQTIDLGGIATPGRFDHRRFLGPYHLPPSLEGARVLDVGCADGFFTFEIEKRGAASVLSVDANRQDGSLTGFDYSPSLRESMARKYEPLGRPEIRSRREDACRRVGAERATAFHFAKAVLGSKAAHRFLSIYDLHELGETFDLVFCGTVSEHLKNPLGAMEQLRSVTGRLCIFAASGMILAPPLSPVKRAFASALTSVARRAGLGTIVMDPDDTLCRYMGHELYNSFFHCTVPAMQAMLTASGFDRVEVKSTFVLTSARGGDLRSPHAVFHCHVGDA